MPPKPTPIDRIAIYIVPQKIAVNWVNKVTGERHTMASLQNSTTLYLAPGTDNMLKAAKWLEKHYKIIFTEFLQTYCTDKSKWPEKLNYDLFTDWFSFHIFNRLIDLTPTSGATIKSTFSSSVSTTSTISKCL